LEQFRNPSATGNVPTECSYSSVTNKLQTSQNDSDQLALRAAATAAAS